MELPAKIFWKIVLIGLATKKNLTLHDVGSLVSNFDGVLVEFKFEPMLGKCLRELTLNIRKGNGSATFKLGWWQRFLLAPNLVQIHNEFHQEKNKEFLEILNNIRKKD